MMFLWPPALLLYLLIPAFIAGYIWMLRRPSRVRVRYSSLDLVAQAAAAGKPWRRHVPAGLYLLTLCAVILTLARPMAPVPVPDNRTVVMLSIDVSRSMMAHDVVPNRIEAAKKAAVEFVRALPRGAKVGLVSFSSYATLVTPPTDDHDRLIQVEGPTDELVTVYRGTERETYSCMPICQRRMTLGDGDQYFKSVLDQAGTLNSQASGTASAANKNN